MAQQKIIVAKDGSGAYKTVQEALDAVPNGNTKLVTIYIKKGIYKERLVADTLKQHIKIIGEDRDQTILTYDNHTGSVLSNGDTVNTRTSASFFIYGNDIRLENLTVENNAGFTAGQAVALMANGNHLSFINCISKVSRTYCFLVAVG